MQAPSDDEDQATPPAELAPEGDEEGEETSYCDVCGDGTWIEGNWLLLCDGLTPTGAQCEGAYHTMCLDPVLDAVPEGDWLCPVCVSGAPPRSSPAIHTAAAANGSLSARQLILKQADCGECNNCLDKPKFGGQNRKKQARHLPISPQASLPDLRSPCLTTCDRVKQACKLKLVQLKALPPEERGKRKSGGGGGGMKKSSKPAAVKDAEDASEESEDDGEAAEANSIDKILDVRARAGSEPSVDEWLCKFRGLAHIHARWLDIEEIGADGRLSKQRLSNFESKRGQGVPIDPYSACLEVERVLSSMRLAELTGASEAEVREGMRSAFLGLPPPTDTGDESAPDGLGASSSPRKWCGWAAEDGPNTMYYMVKWRGCGYDACTWECLKDASHEAVEAFTQRKANAMLSEAVHAPLGIVADASTDVPQEFKPGKQLRDYQRDGVRWLRYNYTQGRGVILGDEMGLGKTAQSVALLQCLRWYHHVRGPFLIIAPLSTLQHWQREVLEWTDLYPIVFHGSVDARNAILDYEWASAPRAQSHRGWGDTLAHPKFDVCITTYETFTQCADTFRKVDAWRYLVLDEAHRLKNKFGKALAAIKSLGVLPTLALTGTPLQNHVGELWTMLNLIDAPAFPSLDEFMVSYGDMQSAEQVKGLTERLRRYLLRRTKGDVDLGLTPMDETLVTVEITNFQKQTYRALLEQNRSLLLKGAQGVSGPSFNNLAMQLRHCCNHPFLIRGLLQAEGLEETADTDEQTYLEKLVASSGKLVLLDKLLPKLQDQGHRVLLFSQFTMLLDLLEEYIRLSEYSYERLDGGITGDRRQAAIDRFSSPESSTFLFLLGTRAGGVGINLTAADTVIIYDPDWNPQNDVQAQARCHRIGQTKTVSVYRLVTKGTYEFTMYERANFKLGLEQAVIGRTDYTARADAGDDADDDGQAGGDPKAKGKLKREKEMAKAKEIESLLKHGAQELFTDEHDAKIAAFTEESIDAILERCATKHTEAPAGGGGGGAASSNFAHAAFVAQDGSEAALDMQDPDFWSKVLGEEEAAAMGDDAEEIKGSEVEYNEDGHVMKRSSRRAGAEPQRLDPRWEAGDDDYVYYGDDAAPRRPMGPPPPRPPKPGAPPAGAPLAAAPEPLTKEGIRAAFRKHVAQATASAKEGRLAEAGLVYLMALRIDRRNTTGLCHVAASNLSAVYAAQANWQHAFLHAFESTIFEPSFAKGYARQAVALTAMHQTEAAQASLQHALMLDPSSALALAHQSKLSGAPAGGKRPRSEDGAANANGSADGEVDAKRRARSTAGGLMQQGIAAFREGEHTTALGLLTQAIEACPPADVPASLHANRAAALEALGQYDDALAAADDAIATTPKWPRGHSRRGSALARLGRVDEAKAAYEEALVLEPGNELLKKAKVALDARDGEA